MTINLKLSRKEILHKYFLLLNIIQSDSSKTLTDSEIELLIEFILLPEKFKYARFSTPAKKRVMVAYENLYQRKLTTINLNNKLYSLLSKGYLRRDTDKILYIQDFIFKAVEGIIDSTSYTITLNLVTSEDVREEDHIPQD